MKKPPITAEEKRPPYVPVLARIELPIYGYDRIGYDQNHVMWIFTQVRRRSYICRNGVTHKLYWRTHWQQGRQDWAACEHELEAADRPLKNRQKAARALGIAEGSPLWNDLVELEEVPDGT